MLSQRLSFALAAATSALLAATLSLPARAQHHFSGQRSHCHALLQANDPGSRITLRAGPGTQHTSRGYGLVGDRVHVLTSTPPELDYSTDRQGYLWYRVGFPGSGASGWIRKDFLDLRCRSYPDL